MKILLSNDDGVHACGLNQLAKGLSTIADDIFIVAPDRNRSGASNSLTLQNPVRVSQLRNNVYSVEGTPTDCVHLALTGLLDEQPDIVVSGINKGANLGDDVLYSGTVAAAMEGRFLGLPAIAVSLVDHSLIDPKYQHYETATTVIKQLLLQLENSPLPLQTILNVNVPDKPIHELRGFVVARLGTRHKAKPMIKTHDPRGNPIYWVGPPGPEADAGEGTDFHAIENGFVSITPLLLDLTHYEAFEQVAGWTDGIKI